MIAGVASSTRALCGRCSRAWLGIRSSIRGQYCAFWNIIGAWADAIPIPSMIFLPRGGPEMAPKPPALAAPWRSRGAARSPRGLEQAVLGGERDGLQAAVHAELAENLLDVVAHGGSADGHPLGRRLGVEAL